MTLLILSGPHHVRLLTALCNVASGVPGIGSLTSSTLFHISTLSAPLHLRLPTALCNDTPEGPVTASFTSSSDLLLSLLRQAECATAPDATDNTVPWYPKGPGVGAELATACAKSYS